jgi:hypothetical protein
VNNNNPFWRLNKDVREGRPCIPFERSVIGENSLQAVRGGNSLVTSGFVNVCIAFPTRRALTILTTINFFILNHYLSSLRVRRVPREFSISGESVPRFESQIAAWKSSS